jgi:hypothetical protein
LEKPYLNKQDESGADFDSLINLNVIAEKAREEKIRKQELMKD